MISSPCFQIYSGIIIGSSVLDLGIRCYQLKTKNNTNYTKVALAIALTLQNISLCVPIACLEYKFWKFLSKDDPLSGKLLAAACIAYPFGYVNYIVTVFGLNPVVALGAPREPKDLTAYFTPYICNIFRFLNVAVVSAAFVKGKISPPCALLTTSACLITSVAQHYLDN